MNDEKTINESLKQFGKDFKGNSLFRVSFSDKQTEIRRRIYNKYSSSGLIFLGEVRETIECKKYPTIKSRWIIEKLVPPDSSYTNEIVSAKENGSYECIYIFQDKNGEFLPLNQRVAEIIIKSILYPGKIGKFTDNSELAQFKEDEKERIMIEENVSTLYEELMKKDMKYPDGSNANKDGSFYLNDATGGKCER